MLAKVFARAVEASFHRSDAGGKNLGDFGMTPALLHQRQQSAVLRTELRERMPQSVELLGIDRAGGLGDIFMLVAERQENAPKLLAPELIDAGVAREPEQPGLELRRRFEPVQRADHFDEHLLRQVFDVIAATGHGVNEPGDSMLVTDHELSLGALFAFLSSADEVHQRGR